MEDLLNFALEHEWSDHVHAGGDYYEMGCGSCGATESVKLKGVPCGEHATDCGRYRLFEDARAFIRAEREIGEGARPMAEMVVTAGAEHGLVVANHMPDAESIAALAKLSGRPADRWSR